MKVGHEFISRKDDELRAQLHDLISRGILVVYETPVEFGLATNKDGGCEIKMTQKISLQVESMRYIEKLEQELEALRELEQALRKARIEEYCNVPCYVDEALDNVDKARRG